MTSPASAGLAARSSAIRTLSAVIPTLDEEGAIEGTLRAARRALGPDAELLVVDGGSRDATCERAAPLARVLSCARGRGPQLNAGARQAGGDVLLFLHADTRLERGAGERIREAVRGGAAGGCFRFAVEPPARGRYRLLQWGVNWRTRITGSATGDQAIFAARASFERVGGFPDWPLFEDVGLVRRLRGVGRFQLLDAVARTSRRRWERAGFWRTILLHWGLRAAFWAGVPPRRLAAWYGDRAGTAGPSLSAG